MGFRLTDDEALAVPADANESVLATLRSAGRSVSLPVRHVAITRVLGFRYTVAGEDVVQHGWGTRAVGSEGVRRGRCPKRLCTHGGARTTRP